MNIVKSVLPWLVCLPVCALAYPPAVPQYPPSTAISDITFNEAVYNVGAPTDIVSDGDRAKGSDIWLNTWGDDDAIYAAWGDGVGFGAMDFNAQNAPGDRALMGVSKITGTSDNWYGTNIAGGLNTSSGSVGHGKPRGIISIRGILYMHIVEEDTFNRSKICRSADHGLTWTTTGGGACLLSGSAEDTNHWDWVSAAPCAHGTSCGLFGPTPLQSGKDNREARDGYVYFYNDERDQLVLARVLKEYIMDRSQYQIFAGKDSAGNPRWDYRVGNRTGVFVDTVNHVGWGNTAIYNPVLHRYLMTVRRETLEDPSEPPEWALYDGPEPWGPWTTVKTYDPNFIDSTWKFIYSFNQKWMSPDGLSVGMIFSGVSQPACKASPPDLNHCWDSFNVIDGTLVLPTNRARISSPMSGSVLVPGQVVTATAVSPNSAGVNIGWTVDRISDGSPEFQTGTGSSITFTVPSDSTASQIIRLTATSNGVSDTRDFAIATGTSAGEARWKLDEGSGTSSTDNSGNNATLTLSAATWTTGKTGAAVDLNGGSASVNAGVRSNLARADQSGLSVSMWIKARSAGGSGSGRLIDKNNDTATGWFVKMNPAGSVTFAANFYTGGALLRTSLPVVTWGDWHHVAVTWDGTSNSSNAHVYVDGALADDSHADGSGSFSGTDASVPLSIGNRIVDSARGFDGAIDETIVYKRVLSEAEIHVLADPHTAPRGYWALNEGSGTSAADTSGNVNTLTVGSGATWTTGHFVNAIDFNGTTGSANAGVRPELSHLNRNGMTVSAWIKPRSVGTGAGSRIVDKDNDTAGWLVKLNSDSKLQFIGDMYTVDAPVRNSSSTVTMNTWQHIAFTWDGDFLGSNIHVYINGGQVDGTYSNGSGTLKDDTATPFSLGNRTIDLARGFDGAIDNVKVFDRPLSPTEIQGLASAP